MAKTALPQTDYTPTHDEIAAQAYQIYLREGCVQGRDLEHWLQAEAELRQRNGDGGDLGTNGHTNDSSRSVSRPLNPATATGPMASVAAAQSVRPATTQRRGAKR